MDHSSDNWIVDQNKAQLVSAGFAAKVDLDQPGKGIALGRQDDANPIIGSALGYEHLPQVERRKVDQYIRGEDMVATYTTESDQASNLRYRDQVYWRYFALNNNPVADGIEVLASLQTDLLDLSPRVQFSSQFEIGELFVVEMHNDDVQMKPILESQSIDGAAGSAFLFKSAEGLSYLQALHDTDRNSCERTSFDFSEGKVTVVVTLHFDHMEKGVIRRLRVRGGLAAASDPSNQDIKAWFDAFASSELPLTV